MERRNEHCVGKESIIDCWFREYAVTAYQNSRLRWLGHLFRVVYSFLPNRTLFSVLPRELKKQHGSQRMTWQRGIKKCTAALGEVGILRFLDWGSTRWLETLEDMTAKRKQWRLCWDSLCDQWLKAWACTVRLYYTCWVMRPFFPLPSFVGPLPVHLEISFFLWEYVAVWVGEQSVRFARLFNVDRGWWWQCPLMRDSDSLATVLSTLTLTKNTIWLSDKRPKLLFIHSWTTSVFAFLSDITLITSCLLLCLSVS